MEEFQFFHSFLLFCFAHTLYFQEKKGACDVYIMHATQKKWSQLQVYVTADQNVHNDGNVMVV
jgi:hypothetical protein